MNNNMWDEHQEYTDQTEEGYAEEALPEQYTQLNQEVVLRFEQAQLYNLLLKESLFQPGSARAEIMEQVDAEIKGFVVERIETLMGMRSPKVEHPESPFSSDEVKALKVLASRLTNRPVSQEPALQPTPVPKEPQLNKVQSVKPVQKPAVAKPVVQTRPVGRQSQPTPAKTAPKPTGRRRRSDNIGAVSGQDLGQAQGSGALPMPSAEAANQHIAAQASRVMSRGQAFVGDNLGASVNQGGAGVDFNSIVTAAVHKNRNEAD